MPPAPPKTTSIARRALICAGLFVYVAYTLTTQQISVGEHPFSYVLTRAEDPVRYWGHLGFGLALGVGCAWRLVAAICTRPHRPDIPRRDTGERLKR